MCCRSGQRVSADALTQTWSDRRTFCTGFNRSGIDFEKSSEDIPTFVSVPDTGILRRFTEPGALSG